MKKIVPHLWFDKEAKEASSFYTSLFPNSKVTSVNTISGTPSGDTDIVSFTLSGLDFMAISAGPIFKFNPSISLFVEFDNQNNIDEVWNKLIDGGKEYMEYQEYPWAKKYGWLQDKYGLSWQLSWIENSEVNQKITPLLMFTQKMAGKAKEAIEFYTSTFKNSKIDLVVPYEKVDADKEGLIKHAKFSLEGQSFMALESTLQHNFVFNEAISFIVNCQDQEEIDYYWNKLSAVPESEQCGWLKDKYGVSWQIVPSRMGEMMSSGTKEQIDRVTQAFLKMKKFDIQELEKAYQG